MLRILLTILGLVAILVGLLWVGQGQGLIRWPADSFMIGVEDWSVRGAVLAALGVALLLVSRRVGRR